MTVSLDDVACLLDIPITRSLIEENELSYEHGLFMLENELGFTADEAMKEVTK